MEGSLEELALCENRCFPCDSSMGGGDLHIFIGPGFDSGSFLRSECFNDFTWSSKDERACGNSGFLSDQSMGADDTLLFNNRSIKNGGSHSDQATIANRTGMNGGVMSNGDVFTDEDRIVISQMYNRSILNVRSFSDTNRLNIGS